MSWCDENKTIWWLVRQKNGRKRTNHGSLTRINAAKLQRNGEINQHLCLNLQRNILSMTHKTVTFICICILLMVIYYTFDPMLSSWMPQCAFHKLTGWSCPICGFQRGLYALLHGQFLKALQSNWFLFGLSPVFFIIFYAEFIAKGYIGRKLQRVFCSKSSYLFLFITAIAWTVIRNILTI